MYIKGVTHVVFLLVQLGRYHDIDVEGNDVRTDLVRRPKCSAVVWGTVGLLCRSQSVCRANSRRGQFRREKSLGDENCGVGWRSTTGYEGE